MGENEKLIEERMGGGEEFPGRSALRLNPAAVRSAYQQSKGHRLEGCIGLAGLNYFQRNQKYNKMITDKINVLAIEKARLFKGEKGTYLDILLIETPNNQHGNSHMIVQAVSKEERLAGIKGPILGNAKTVGAPQQPKPAVQTTTIMKPGVQPPEDTGEIPF